MEAAYYHAGMAVEALLKAYLWRLNRWTAHPTRKIASYLYHHDLSEMMGRTGLINEIQQNPVIWASWQTVRAWSHHPRYHDGDMPRAVALSMVGSVRHPDYGVFPWVLERYQKIS